MKVVTTVEYEYDDCGRVSKETRTETFTDDSLVPIDETLLWALRRQPVQPIPGATCGWKPGQVVPPNPVIWPPAPNFSEQAAPGTAYQGPPVMFSYSTDNLNGANPL